MSVYTLGERLVSELRPLAQAIHRRDCPRVKRWLRTAKLERYKTVEQALTAAERALKPKAVNWQAIWDFLKEVLPIFLAVLLK